MIQEILDSLNMDNIIDFNLNIMKNNQSLVKLTSRIMIELEKIYELEEIAIINNGMVNRPITASEVLM